MVKFFVLASLFREPPDLRDSFEAVYALKGDPWRYELSAYEQGKYRDTIATLGPGEWSNALEIGSAEGVFTRMLAQLVTNVTGVDVSMTAIKRARERCADLSRVCFLHLDVEVDTLPSDEFDLIVCSEVLYYLNDRIRIENVGHKLMSSLKPGGHLVLVDRRIKSDDTSGFAAPIFGYPSMGAKTVHQTLRSLQGLTQVKDVQRKFYAITVLRKHDIRE